MELTIYNPQKVELTEIAFVKDTVNQIKIRDINNLYELTKQLSIIISSAFFHLGMKEEMTEITKRDIKELILMRFKGLSLDEICYAFKLERYGVLGDKTQSYGLYNANYVSTVLDKYIIWKRKIKSDNNLPIGLDGENSLTEDEKNKIIRQGLIDCYDHFVKTGAIEPGRIYLYDVLYGIGQIPTSKEYKIKIKKIAAIDLENELKSKIPQSLKEKRELSEALSGIHNNSAALIVKCKETVLKFYFKKKSKEEILEVANMIYHEQE